MAQPKREEELVHAVLLRNAAAIRGARQRAAEDVLAAKEELERRTGELARALDESKKLRRFTRALVRAAGPADVARIVCEWARELVDGDGATFVQREGDMVHHVAEDAVGPLWAGQRVPLDACISGWAILNRQNAVIADVDVDGRIPLAAYRPTFVRALLVVPVREVGFSDLDEGPPAAIGIYWARRHEASPDQVRLLEAIADAAAVALARARLHDEIQEARRQAEAANRAKDEFIATVSHEMRQPLTSIVGWVRVLRMAGVDETQQRHALDVIDRNARIQVQLIEDLLDVSRMAAAQLSITLESVELGAAVEAAVDATRPIADEKEIRLTCVVDREAGPVSGDPGRLQQVAANLLSNAIKFTPKGGQVDVRLERVASWLELRVSDTGQGIDPAFLPHVFERFRQEGAARRYGGLGLGLTIVRHLVELHGGTVHAASPGQGRGATFTVRLPALGAAPSPTSIA